MAGKTYVKKGYSTYTDIPAQRGGYGHRPQQPVNWYVVETTTIKRIRTSATGYTYFDDSPSEREFLAEYIHAPSILIGPKYGPKDHYEGYEPNYRPDYENSSPPHHYRRDLEDRFINKVEREASRPMKNENFSSPNMHRPLSPVQEETHLIRSRSLSSPSKYRPSSPDSEGGRNGRTGYFSSPNNYWLAAGPPVTHHPLTTSTNDINEALSFLQESVNYSMHSGLERAVVPDDKYSHPQPIKPKDGYARPTNVGATIAPHFYNNGSGNTIDSQEAIRKYNGTRVL